MMAPRVKITAPPVAPLQSLLGSRVSNIALPRLVDPQDPVVAAMSAPRRTCVVHKVSLPRSLLLRLVLDAGGSDQAETRPRQVVFDLDSSCGSRAVWITACWRSINDAIQPTSDALHGGFATDRCGVRPDFADHVADRLRQQQVSIVSLGLAHGQAVVGMADQLRTLVEQAQAAHSQHLDSVLSASPRGEWVDPALRAPVRPVAVFPLPAASEDTITDVMRMCAAHGGGPAVTLCPNSLAVTAAEVCGHARAIRATHPVTRDSDTSSRAVGRFAFPPQEGLPAGGGDPVDVGDANAVKLERQCVVVFGGGMANALYRSTLRLHNVMQSRPADPDVEP